MRAVGPQRRKISKEEIAKRQTSVQAAGFARLTVYRMASLVLAVLRRERIAAWARVIQAMRDPADGAGIIFQMSTRKWMQVDRAVQLAEALADCLRPYQYPRSARYSEDDDDEQGEGAPLR